MDTEGRSSLDVFEFGVLLQALATAGKVGALRVACVAKNATKEKWICLNEGKVEAIYTPRARYRVGRILFNMHAVEMEDLKAVLEDKRRGRTERLLGEELVARKLVSREELESALRYQIVEEILEVFYWRDVNYEFFTGPLETVLCGREKDLVRVGGPQEASGILLNVSKFLDEIEKFQHQTPSMRDVYEMTADPTEFLAAQGVPATIGDVATLVDGVRDMGEVLKLLRLNRFEAMDLFYRLSLKGLIRARSPFELLMLAEDMREELSASKRARLYERATELGIEGLDVAIRTAEIYEEMGKKEKAAGHYASHAGRLKGDGFLDTALTYAGRAVKLCPEHVEYRELEVEILTRLGRNAEAVNDLLAIARSLGARGEVDSAEDVLDRAMTLAPGRTDVFLAKAEILAEADLGHRAVALLLCLANRLEGQGDVEGALEAVRRAIRIRPRAFRSRRAASRLLAATGDKNGAAAALGGMVELVLDRTREKPARTIALLRHIERSIRALNATWHPALTAVADAYAELNEKEAALAAFVSAGEARVAEGRLAEARDAWQKACELAPEDLDLAETLALVHARLGAREHAVARLRGIAGLYWKRGRLDRAEKALHEILRLDPFSPDALLEMARLKADQGRRKEAAKAFYRLGHLYQTGGDIEAAVTYFDEACRLDPSDPEHVRALADGLGKTLKIEKSIDSFEALLAMLRARGDLTRVIEVAFRILEAAPDNRDAGHALVEAWQGLGRRVRTWVKSSELDA